MNELEERRDERLGAALRQLDLPEHEPAFDDGLRARLEQPRPHRRLWVLAPVAGIAAALVAGSALLLSMGSDVASAAEVRAAVREALSSAETLSGMFVNREGDTPVRWTFFVSSSGSFRITGITTRTELVYDPGRNVENYSDGPNFVRRVGLAPGWPDPDPADWVLQRGLGSVVAALSAAGDADVDEIEYRNRPAWRLRTPTGNEGELRLLTVDRETGIPVRNVLLRRGRLVAEWWIEELRVDAGAPADFELEPTSGQEVSTYDAGFRRIPLEEVEEVVGYAPIVPAWVPAGYTHSEVAVAERSRPTGGEQSQNPSSRAVVSLSYRRGLDEIVVTTRLAGPDRARWTDPVLASSLLTRKPETIAFGAGTLRGSSGEVLIDPNTIPHVWAVTPQLVVTVAGNMSRSELLRVAESLHPS